VSGCEQLNEIDRYFLKQSEKVSFYVVPAQACLTKAGRNRAFLDSLGYGIKIYWE